MLTPPDLSDEAIIGCLRDAYGRRVVRVTFLPIGADAHAAVYRVEADDGTPYFLKVKLGGFDEVAVAVPAYLRARGIRRVMAAIPTTTGGLWVRGRGVTWILYPFVEGHDGYEAPLSYAHWVALGESLRAIHATALPPELGGRVPREDFAPRWRDVVEGFDRQVGTAAFDDPIAARFAAFWGTRREEIRAIVERAARLAGALQGRTIERVLCHTDLHAWNVLVGRDGELFIVDWDEPLLAPRERDLMFVGGGVGGIWNTPREEALFYEGYGATAIDAQALAYYRYERIVADLAAYGEQLFGAQGSVEDREEGLRQVMGQFVPDAVVDIAHRTYRQLA